MRHSILLLLLALSVSGCKGVECGDGTLERDGMCVAADQSTAAAKCGAFTVLVNDQCIPMFPPTVCDVDTTAEDTDSSTGVTTCIGTGGGGCGTPIACPTPATGKQSICGQLYDFETGAPFAAPGATATRCTGAPTASGPCSLRIRAFDALMFAMNPTGTPPLAIDDTYLDDCGRYRLRDITVPGGPFIALGIDDADAAKAGPMGTTNTTGVATATASNTATKGLEAFVVPASTTAKWASSGGPAVNGGIYSLVFRASSMGLANAAGVSVANLTTETAYYFQPAQTTRSDVMPGATVSGANGTALVTGAVLTKPGGYTGTTTTLPAECEFSRHAGIALPFIVFVQIVRPVSRTGMTCNL